MVSDLNGGGTTGSPFLYLLLNSEGSSVAFLYHLCSATSDCSKWHGSLPLELLAQILDINGNKMIM